jgi:ketopantoate reductase
MEACKVLHENKHLKNVLFLGNDISGFNYYSELLPRESILLGFPGAGGGYENDRLIIVDSDKSGGKKTSIYIGEINGGVSKRVLEIKRFFESAGQPVSAEKNIDGWLKYHYAFIAPTAGVVFKNNIDLQKAAADDAGLRKYIHACREAGDVLKDAGYRKRQPPIFNLYYFLPEFLAPKVFKKLFGSRFAEVAIGLHAKAIGSEFQEMKEEFRELQKTTSRGTPNLDELLDYFPKA